MTTKEDEIIEATIRIVGERGLINFSSRALVAELKCSNALIYKYFETNDILFQRCGEKVRERRHQRVEEILKSIDILADYHEINLKIFSSFIETAMDHPDDCNFYYALRNTKYESVVAIIDDRSTDPLYKAISRIMGNIPEERHTEFLITYDYTMKTLNSLIRAVTYGFVPKTEETYRNMAELLCRGVGTFFMNKDE